MPRKATGSLVEMPSGYFGRYWATVDDVLAAADAALTGSVDAHRARRLIAEARKRLANLGDVPRSDVLLAAAQDLDFSETRAPVELVATWLRALAGICDCEAPLAHFPNGGTTEQVCPQCQADRYAELMEHVDRGAQ